MTINDITNMKFFNAVDLHCDMTYKDPYHGDRTIYPNWADLERPKEYLLQVIGFDAKNKGIDFQEYINSIPEYEPVKYNLYNEYKWARWQEQRAISILNTNGEKKLISTLNLDTIQSTKIDNDFKEGDEIIVIRQGDYRTWLKTGKVVKIKRDTWGHDEIIEGYHIEYEDGIKDYRRREALDFRYF